mmetsp:Transcript_51004/g.119269  ORF Transcript_51004/g.119269 Transcript_51004/m.119269 type:complete len:520 (+) Transcript_51004:271-1830(+)
MKDLCSAFMKLAWVDEALFDTTAKEPRDNSAYFLALLGTMASSLCLQPSSRDYRQRFSPNYKRLMSNEEGDRYNADVLKAAVQWTHTIYVNGNMYEFSNTALEAAGHLRQEWVSLIEVIGQEARELSRSAPSGPAEPSQSFRDTLEKFDAAWVTFEKIYIFDLMHIEDVSREPLVHAMQTECRLQEIEQTAPDSRLSVLLADDAYYNLSELLVTQVGQINAVANTTGIGRSDLDISILMAVVKDSREGHSADQCRAFAESLAAKVYESWAQIRVYLRQMSPRIEHVDPQIRNNVGLVKMLATWEEDWATARAFFCDETMCNIMCEIVSELEAVRDTVPEFDKMVDEGDAELFLIIPRVVLVHVCMDPEPRKAVLRKMVPELFSEQQSSAAGASTTVFSPSDFVSLCNQFKAIKETIFQQLAPATDPQEIANRLRGETSMVWKLCVELLVSQHQDRETTGLLQVREQVKQAVKDFLLLLEPWSIMLQRNFPTEWNRFCQAICDNLTEIEEPETEDGIVHI